MKSKGISMHGFVIVGPSRWLKDPESAPVLLKDQQNASIVVRTQDELLPYIGPRRVRTKARLGDLPMDPPEMRSAGLRAFLSQFATDSHAV
jgi:hypothetical protein